MKHFTQLAALATLGLSALAPQAQAQERITLVNVQDGEQSVGYKLWICIIGCEKQAVCAVKLNEIVSVNKHMYTVDGIMVKECTIDTTGNNSIRFYCMNNTAQSQKMMDRTKNTRGLVDGKTGGATQKPAKKFPEGTYSHNVEYLIDTPDKIDDIYESALNAVIRNKGCTYKVN